MRLSPHAEHRDATRLGQQLADSFLALDDILSPVIFVFGSGRRSCRGAHCWYPFSRSVVGGKAHEAVAGRLTIACADLSWFTVHVYPRRCRRRVTTSCRCRSCCPAGYDSSPLGYADRKSTRLNS